MKKKTRFKFRGEASTTVANGVKPTGPWRASFDKAKDDIASFESIWKGSGRIIVEEVEEDEVFFYGVFISLSEIGVKRKIRKDPHQ